MTCDRKIVVHDPAARRVVQTPGRDRVVVETPAQTPITPQVRDKIVVHDPVTDLTITKPVARVVEVVSEGPQGPVGPAGSGGTLTLPIGETIHGLRAVRAAGGLLFHPDIDTPAHADQVVGIAIASATSGTCNVRTEGPVTEPSWSWSPGFVFVGTDGQLTQSPGATGWLLAVGRAINATTIDVDVDTPFMR